MNRIVKQGAVIRNIGNPGESITKAESVAVRRDESLHLVSVDDFEMRRIVIPVFEVYGRVRNDKSGIGGLAQMIVNIM